MKGPLKMFLVFCLFVAGSSLTYAQYEERPRWAPRAEKHRNVRDEVGRKQGLWKFYSYSKVLLYQVTFVNDIRHGPAIRHSSASGIIIEESNYFNGKRDGDFKRYTSKGVLTTEGTFTVGRRTGQWTSYYPVNGEKRTEGGYVNGKREGIWKYFSSKGKIVTEGEFKYGEREGTWVYYANDGSKAAEKKFVKGREIGVVTTGSAPKRTRPEQNPRLRPKPKPGDQQPSGSE